MRGEHIYDSRDRQQWAGVRERVRVRSLMEKTTERERRNDGQILPTSPLMPFQRLSSALKRFECRLTVVFC